MIKVSIISFSYKRGLPKDLAEDGGGFVFDCRLLPNPYWDESLRKYTGRERLHVAFGCTGGQHRSVYCAEVVAGRLRGLSGVEVTVDHAAREFWKT